MLVGKRDYVERGSYKAHSTLQEAKRHCTKVGNCFGVRVFNFFSDTTEIISINFPVLLYKYYEKSHVYYIHKKEDISGTFCIMMQFYCICQNDIYKMLLINNISLYFSNY